MKPIKTQKENVCLAACVAAIFECGLKHVQLRIPKEGETCEKQIDDLGEWAGKQGYVLVFADMGKKLAHILPEWDFYYIASGRGAGKNYHRKRSHSVVCRAGKVVYDPNGGEGIKKIEWIVFFVPVKPKIKIFNPD